ncbi:MAG: glycosyltransferase family 39 protein [Candidatus Gracilibacteria bacterium]|nr:glycosyltransferase family 39 protein [Candidatus Gracilibacteria bacterium]
MLSKEKFFKIIKNIFLFLFAISLLFSFFVKTKYASIVGDSINIQYGLLILTLVFLSLVFYTIRYKISLIESDIINEKFISNHKSLYQNITNQGKVYLSFFILITIICFSNIFINLGSTPFHQDEKYHFSPAYTYSQTGEFARWDFLYDEVGDAKWTDRNLSLSIVTSYSQQIFGLSEFSSRLPVAIVGFLGLFLIYYIVIKITGNAVIGLISMYIYSVNDIVLYFSRFLRAYVFLIIISLILFYFLYKLFKSSKIKDKLVYSSTSIIIFIIGLFEFHATIIMLFPLLAFVLFITILNTFKFKKYYPIYLIFVLLGIIFVLNSIGFITLFKMPFGIQNMINLKIDFFSPIKIYLSHLSNPFNLGFSLEFLLISLLFLSYKKIYKNLFLIFSLFVPIIFSLYFFNRYEDFRYIALIQGIFIFYVSILIYYIWLIVINNGEKKNYYLLVFITIIFIPLQFPYLPQFQPFTKLSQANWQNIEGTRIHFRAAKPDNVKAFDYIFDNFDNIVLLRLADGGINWDDNYYLSKYVKNYSNKSFIFYNNNRDSGTNFDELYNSNKSTKKFLENDLNFFDILDKNEQIIVVGSTRDLVNVDVMKYLDTKCENIASRIGIVKYRIFSYMHPEENYFPNVFLCEGK